MVLSSPPFLASEASSLITQLLVSVRDLSEAEIAFHAGVDIIDFKEPAEGALSPTDPQVWEQAEKRFAGHPMSAALGEFTTASTLASRVPAGFQFAKMGPSRTPSVDELIRRWESLCLPEPVQLVAVAYADFEHAHCPSPSDILDAAVRSGRNHVLLDTFGKDGRHLLDHCPLAQLSELIIRANQQGIWFAIAGSLDLPQLQTLADNGVSPDCIGIRGAACRPGRAAVNSQRRIGRLDEHQVAIWRRRCVHERSEEAAAERTTRTMRRNCQQK